MTKPAAAKGRLSGWTLVFDLDGTLVDSAPDLLGAVNHCLGLKNVAPVALDDIHTLIGSGAKAMLRQALTLRGVRFDDADIDALWTPFIAHYRAHIADASRPFPGVEAALDILLEHGATLAVCTNKTQVLSDQLLTELNLADYFAAVIGADSVPARKPNGEHILAAISAASGDPARAFMIGDSRTDEKAALNAGLPFIFVPFGYEQAPADSMAAAAIVSHYADLKEAIFALIA